MFGTLGFSELILILAIILIIFGAGRLPQIGEGIGKALKGFKKEVNEPPPPMDPDSAAQGQPEQAPAPTPHPIASAPAQVSAPDVPRPAAPYQPGPELTPGTTAALMASAAPQVAQPRSKTVHAPPAAPDGRPVTAATPTQPPTMEDRLSTPPPSPRGVYPPLPPAAQPKPSAKRPSAVVNKDAVARVQAQQAAMREAAVKKGGKDSGLSSQDMQGLGESLGDTLRTFRQAAADVRNAVDPEMRTIRAELDAAQKELQQSIEAAKEMPAVTEDPPKES
jgi:TatA/E family protein of Tat protein translocase